MSSSAPRRRRSCRTPPASRSSAVPWLEYRGRQLDACRLTYAWRAILAAKQIGGCNKSGGDVRCCDPVMFTTADRRLGWSPGGTMAGLIKGLHHITLCASGAQEDVDFCTKVMGQRLIKQTVLFDGRYAHYHFYYANANAEPGSVMTTFPYKRVPGRPGAGQVSSSAYTIPKGAVSFWKEHLDRHKTPHTGIQERFGQKYIRFTHPSGLQFDAIETEGDNRVGWNTDQIKADTAMRGFSGTVLSVREIEETVRFFTEALGF